jgi:hypothetical protein
MSLELSEFKSIENKIIDMKELPDWHYEPSTPLWEMKGELVPKVVIQYAKKEIQPPYNKFPELKEERDKIKEDENNFNGPIANVEGVNISSRGIEIKTSTARFLDYTASSNYFREKNIQKENPIRPLATQAVFLTPDNEIIFARRSNQVFDFPNSLSEFGGVLKPDKTDVISSLAEILEKKLAIKLDRSQFQIVGMERENVNNIFHIFQLVRLTKEQTESLLLKFKELRKNIVEKERSPTTRKEKLKETELLYKVSTKENLGHIERILRHFNIKVWNPAAYTNILYALLASKLRTPEQILKLSDDVHEDLKKIPFEYNKKESK